MIQGYGHGKKLETLVGLLEAVKEQKLRQASRPSAPRPAQTPAPPAAPAPADAPAPPRKGFLARLLAVFGLGGDDYGGSGYAK